jgi:NAD-dependent deacetylase sirtuin 4
MLLKMLQKVTFFGESLSPAVRDLSKEWVSDSTQLLIIGSSLATFSAFRLVRQKIEEGGKVLLLNVGESRGDLLATERIGWDGGCVEIVPDAARAIFEDMRSGLDQEKMEEIEILLRSGNIKKVPEEGFSTS